MSREIVIYDVTTAKVSHVDVEHVLSKHFGEDCVFVFETKAWLELDNAAVQVREFKEDWDESMKVLRSAANPTRCQPLHWNRQLNAEPVTSEPSRSDPIR